MDRILAVAALLASPFAAAQSLIPLEHFAADPQFSQPAMSPDGSRVVYIGWANGKPYIILLDLETQARKALGVGAADQFTVNAAISRPATGWSAGFAASTTTPDARSRSHA